MIRYFGRFHKAAFFFKCYQNLTDAIKHSHLTYSFFPFISPWFQNWFLSTFRSFYRNPAQPGAYLVIIKMTYTLAFRSKKDVRNLRYFPGNYKTNKFLCSSILLKELSSKDSFQPCISVHWRKKKKRKKVQWLYQFYCFPALTFLPPYLGLCNLKAV